MDPQAIQFITEYWYIFLAINLLWELPWKGVGLWMAARRGHWIWFVIFLVVNSLALLPIIYIFFIGRTITVEEEEILEE